MTPEEKLLNKASIYVMPALEDYLGARCLLLNNVFVGLTLAHEAVEKLMKSLLILEKIQIPHSCHKITELKNLLVIGYPKKYSFLNDAKEFIDRLDKHYNWRYYDGDPRKRSQNRSPEDLQPTDNLWIRLYECYISFIPQIFRYRNYLNSYLFNSDIKEYTLWSEWLIRDNRAVAEKLVDWEREYKKA